jgi:hypothetical protein
MAERGSNHKKPMGVAGHPPKTRHEYGSLGGQGMDQICQVLALHHARIFQPGNGIIAEFERPFFDSGEPSCEARTVQRVLLSSIHQ